MSIELILMEPTLAVAKPAPKGGDLASNVPWLGISGGLVLLSVAFGAFSFWQIAKMSKKLRMEDFKTKDLQKKLKLALETIRKMETNPDLVHSREFNLDYLRMRMAEEVFHFAVVNQIKVKVKEKISVALRPNAAAQTTVGIANNSGRQVDEMFDVEYQTGDSPKSKKAVLFRIQIRLMKLPTQATSVTINQIIDCIETFLSPTDEHDNWQPTIQGRIVHMEWDQKAKPTPMLVIEQSNEGVNVSFATKRQTPGSEPLPPPPPPKRPSATKGQPAAAKGQSPAPKGQNRPSANPANKKTGG